MTCIETLVGQRVRAVRLAKKLTMAQLAEKAGCSTATVQRVECGYFQSRLGTYLKISGALECTLEELVEGIR